jgi:hypothetical protein
LENEFGFEIYVPQDSLRGCWRGANPAERGEIYMVVSLFLEICLLQLKLNVNNYMKKLKLPFIFLILFVMLSSSKINYQNTTNEDYIVWDENRKLTWDDFKGKPNTKSKFKAITRTLVVIKVSWTKLNTDELLKHEQLHFDISELMVRKFRKSLCSYNLEGLEKFNSDIQQEYNYVLQKIKKLNALYDKETNHGIIKKKQEEWEKKIQKELDDLKEYNNRGVTIKK